MKMKFKILILISILLVSISPLVYAQSITFQDSDMDSDPDFAVIQTDFAQGNDVVLVFDQDDDMIESSKWNKSCDFDSDIWIFDKGNDGNSELIIDFGEYNGKLAAFLYDDNDNDGKVSYQIENDKISITEAGTWKVLVISYENWWIKNDKINYNFDILVDGSTRSQQNLQYKDFINDGIVDSKIEIRDTDGDSVQDYDLRIDYSPKQHVYFMVNEDDFELPIRDYVFWPLLGSKYKSFERPYWTERSDYSAPPPIQIDWNSSKIINIVEVVSLRGGEDNWGIISGEQWGDKFEKNKTNHLMWEVPFSFYDLAGDVDGFPELIIRPQYETITRGLSNPILFLRYSWHQDDDKSLDYRVSLIGRVEYNDTVNFPDFSIATIPHDEFPNWIYNQKWNASVFVDANNAYYVSSEGIYEGQSFAPLMEYYSGRKATISISEYLPPKLGMRAEYNIDLNAPPRIYFSPIDNKLHLLKAIGGTWSIDETQKIKYQNFNNDEYIDGWSFFKGEEPTKHLIHNNNFLIYSDKEKIKLMKTKIGQSIFEIFPPRNSFEWENLGNLLKKHEGDTDPIDFEAMFNKFTGKSITIENGFLSEFIADDEGFKFLMNCTSECKVDSFTEIDYAKPLSKGEYLLVYDGRFSIEKFIGRDLAVGTSDIIFSNLNPVELEHIIISADIHNNGMLDLDQLLVQFFDGNPSSDGILIGNKIITSLPSSGTETVSLRWAPRMDSEDIYVAVDPLNSIDENNEGNNIAFKSIRVTPAKQPSTLERLTIGTEKTVLAFVFLIFAGMIILAFYISKSIFS